MALERRRYRFRGHVQGVGFRYTARRIAANYAVTGHVRNLEDGRVEVVAEGEPAELEGFLGEVSEAFRTNIRTVDRDVAALDGPRSEGFTIAY